MKLEEETKTCKICLVNRPVSDFHKGGRPNEYDSRCKECKKLQYRANREDILARASDRYEVSIGHKPKVCPDCGVDVSFRGARCKPCAYTRQREMVDVYQAANPERVRASKRASNRRRYANDPVFRQRTIQQASERNRNLSAADSETLEYIAIIRNDPCTYCGRESVAIDHIDPVSNGGSNHWSNMTPACTSCNSSKNARTDVLVWMLENNGRVAA